jgi:hypothetical protein
MKSQAMTQVDILDTVQRYRTGGGRRYPIIRLGVFGSAARDRGI